MAGTITFEIRGERHRSGMKCLICSWTSDGSGDVSGTASPTVRGEIRKIVTDPDGTDAPTDDYDIVINDEHGIDVALGLLADRDTANTEVVYPAVQHTDGANTGSFPNAVDGALTPVVSAAGDTKKGVIYIYFNS